MAITGKTTTVGTAVKTLTVAATKNLTVAVDGVEEATLRVEAPATGTTKVTVTVQWETKY